jgi:transposase
MIDAMLNTALSLPDDPRLLQEMIAQLQAQLAAAEQTQNAQAAELQEQRQRIDQLLEYIELLRRKRFGPSTDRIPEAQLKLFDEAELEALIGELESELAQTQPPTSDTTKPAGKSDPTAAPPVRRPLPAHLPRVERVIDLPADTKAALGEDWHLIGYDRSEQLAVIPRQTYVIVYLRAKYVARDAAVPGAEAGVKIAPRAAQLIPKSMAHGSLLAAIVTAKFVDALPLYRQAQVFAREGIDLSRQTMAGWLMQLEAPLQPLAKALRAALRQGPVVHVDETSVQVLREPEREATQKSYMWVFCGGPPEQPVRWFE